MVIDHIDLRVRDVDQHAHFMMRFLRRSVSGVSDNLIAMFLYYRFAERRVQEAVAVIGSPSHIAYEVRLAFHAGSLEDVDRIAAIARDAGAREYYAPQWCPEIVKILRDGLEDPSGNRLEVVCR